MRPEAKGVLLVSESGDDLAVRVKVWDLEEEDEVMTPERARSHGSHGQDTDSIRARNALNKAAC